MQLKKLRRGQRVTRQRGKVVRLMIGTLLFFTSAACQSTGESGRDRDLSPLDQVGDQGDRVNDGGGGEDDAGAPTVPDRDDVCRALSLPRRPLKREEVGLDFGDRAGPFAFTALDGARWDLESAWSGCESYVFLVHFPNQSPGRAWVGDVLWESVLAPLFEQGPRNVRYVFISYELDAAQRRAALEARRARLLERLEERLSDPTERSFWAERFHFVTERAVDLEGSVGPFLARYLEESLDPESRVDLGERGVASMPIPFAFAIDRAQRWDAVGSLSPFPGEAPSWSMLPYAPHFYNHQRALADSIEETPAEERILLDERLQEREFTRAVELPDADTMAGFDTLEFDITVRCPYRNVFACSEWDRIARISLCLDESCEDRRELVRWITPYWRRGERRWLIDASPLIFFLDQGGEQRFRIELGPSWERPTEKVARIAIRLRNRGRSRAFMGERLFIGGEFNGDYAAAHPPVDVEIPAGATRGEIAVILSGHGQAEGSNCAEWCDHRHLFSIGETRLPVLRSEIEIGDGSSCARRAAEGVVPGQFGNWAPGRAYWCPGLPVPLIQLPLPRRTLEEAGPLTLGYEASFAGAPPPGGQIALSAYLVWYRE
ncbi:MAG: peptide-N-glycosidase F-related protein [Myxococcota bacterium]|nr:peptide-N-glycosidase F-related protein [Myxococcota bacterium]